MNRSVKEFLATIGKKGGSVRSEAKSKAGKANTEKAREALALKRLKQKGEQDSRNNETNVTESITEIRLTD